MEKKIAIRLFIVLIVMVLGIVIGYIYWGMSTLSSTTEIDLTKLTLEEKAKLIEYNYLELANYPKSLEFIKLKEESEVRETQFIITFSVDNNEKDLYQIERDKTSVAGESSVFRIKEEMSKDELENYRKIKEKIRSLIERLEKNQSNENVIRKEFEEFKKIYVEKIYNPAKEELQKQLNNYIVTYNIMQKGAKDFEEIQKYIDKENKLKALQERIEQTEKEEEIQNIKSEFESIIDF